MSPFWDGLWREDAGKSNIFVPATLSIQARSQGEYRLMASGNRRLSLQCIAPLPPQQSCRSLAEARQAAERAPRSGVEYKLITNGAKLEVNAWRIVPDGSRLTDTDVYIRSTPGTGFSGHWRKVRSSEAPTVYQISVHGGRMSFMAPNGELNISFSLEEASNAQGAYVALGPTRGNTYRILGPLKILEQSVRGGKIVARSVLSLSADGQTMTEDHTDAGPSPNALHIVYDRD